MEGVWKRLKMTHFGSSSSKMHYFNFKKKLIKIKILKEWNIPGGWNFTFVNKAIP